MILQKKQITEHSWLFYKDSVPIAILTLNNKVYTLLLDKEKHIFNNHQEIEDLFGVVEDLPSSYTTKDIDGFTIRHTSATDITYKDKIPVYKAGGTIYFAAGYYVSKTKGKQKFSVVFCPKYSILVDKDTEFKGPFKSKLEALREIKLL